MKTNADLNAFIKWHFNYQNKALKMSNQAEAQGFNGFAFMFQIEASDAFIHTRRMLNYAHLISLSTKIDMNCDEVSYEGLTITELMKKLVEIKKAGLILTNKFSTNAAKAGDYLAVKFYEWYLQDFAHEIDEQTQIIEYMKQYPDSSIWKLDRKFDKTEEPNYELISKPFSPYHKY